MCRLYANTMPFYIRDLSIHGFWYVKGVLEPIPCGYIGMTVYFELTSITIIVTEHFFFCLALRTFKIYSPNNFQICDMLLLAIVIMLYITLT